jgi:aerotaxis receptor
VTQTKNAHGQEEISYRDLFVNSNKSFFQAVIQSKVKYEEYNYGHGISISSTNLNGVITYVNRKFCEISGYSKDELLGKSHNITRHPDMPKELFNQLWKDIHNGKDWVGIMKNLRKDGRYYWAYSHIVPIIENDYVVGYSSLRKPVLRNELDGVITQYSKMLLKEMII